MAKSEVVLRTTSLRSPRRTYDLLTMVGPAVLVFVSGCGGSTVRNPVAPSAASASNSGIIATVSPVPLMLRASADGASYLLNADASFRDMGGEGGRIASIGLELVDGAGQGDMRRVTLDLTVAPGATVTRPLSETMHLVPGHPPVRLHLSTTVIDRDGLSQFVPDVDVPVQIAGPASTTGALDATFVGAGDIANCDVPGSEATARLIDRIPGDVFTLGDNVYPSGSPESFTRCYEPTWGRHKQRTHPNPGNHDWDVAAGAPYFSYFGPTSGPSGLGYYSFNLGAWHILSLNSNIVASSGSPQYEWARRDLTSAPAPCTLAYWHHPLFSSGPNGNNGQMRDMWRLLDNAGVDLVLVGHDHLYERFAPQDADGNPTPAGMREFVVGTGGGRLYNPASVQPNSEVRNNDTWGVLKLALRGNRYDWEFVPVDGQSFRDFGSAACLQ